MEYARTPLYVHSTRDGHDVTVMHFGGFLFKLPTYHFLSPLVFCETITAQIR